MSLRAGVLILTGKRAISHFTTSFWSTSSVHSRSRLFPGSFQMKSCGRASNITRYDAAEMAKVVQGHVPARNFSTTVNGNQKKQDPMAERHEDPAYPNETWTPESIALFNKLVQETKDSPQDWRKMPSPPAEGEVRLFLRNVPEHGKVFEYAMFLNKKARQLKGVVQFGPYTQGPPGHVHGGAIASILDSAIGVCSFKSLGPSVTANLSINFKRGIPLGTTAYGEARVDRLEGRKIFGSGELKSPDGQIVYAQATALFISVSRDAVTSEEVADY